MPRRLLFRPPVVEVRDEKRPDIELDSTTLLVDTPLDTELPEVVIPELIAELPLVLTPELMLVPEFVLALVADIEPLIVGSPPRVFSLPLVPPEMAALMLETVE